MNQHTPGPWVVSMAVNGRTSVYPIVDNEVGSERVADVYCPLNIDGGHIGANARLIAAAPEMLVMMLRLIDMYYQPTDCGTQALVEARALLARIEGDTT